MYVCKPMLNLMAEHLTSDSYRMLTWEGRYVHACKCDPSHRKSIKHVEILDILNKEMGIFFFFWGGGGNTWALGVIGAPPRPPVRIPA